jgi:mRNA interferase RelE/StbE
MKIELHKSVEKFLDRLPLKQKSRLAKAIFKLPQGDNVPLTGFKGKFRLRVGGWRIVWVYQDYGILVVEIDNRGDAYRK